VYVPAAGWRIFATRGMASGPAQPFLLAYRIGDGYLVLTTSALGYSGGFEMFGSATPLNTVKLVENLRALQDSLYSYSLSSLTFLDSAGSWRQTQEPIPDIFKVANADQAVVYTVIQSAKDDQAIIKITDISGRILANRKVNLQKGNNRVDIPVSIASGNIYIATMITGSKRYSVKFLKKCY
jgi:hypothetical protein